MIQKVYVFCSQEVSQSCSSTHGTKEYKPASLVQNTHVKTISKIPCLLNSKNTVWNEQMNYYSNFSKETEKLRLNHHCLGVFQWIHLLTSMKINSKGIVELYKCIPNVWSHWMHGSRVAKPGQFCRWKWSWLGFPKPLSNSNNAQSSLAVPGQQVQMW